MSSGWDVYYLFLVSAMASLLWLGFIWLLRKLLRRSRERQIESSLTLSSSVSGPPERLDLGDTSPAIHIRYLVGALHGVGSFGFALLVLPCLGLFGSDPSQNFEVGVGLVLTVVVLAGVFFLYANRVGDVRWDLDPETREKREES